MSTFHFLVNPRRSQFLTDELNSLSPDETCLLIRPIPALSLWGFFDPETKHHYIEGLLCNVYLREIWNSSIRSKQRNYIIHARLLPVWCVCQKYVLYESWFIYTCFHWRFLQTTAKHLQMTSFCFTYKHFIKTFNFH